MYCFRVRKVVNYGGMSFVELPPELQLPIFIGLFYHFTRQQ